MRRAFSRRRRRSRRFRSGQTKRRASRSPAILASWLSLTTLGVGTPTIIEVLNAEQDLLNSQVGRVGARHDRYIAGYQLLNAMGEAKPELLGASN